jgi:hypothetical protein
VSAPERTANACPDWRALAAHRFARDGEEPAGWADALAHLDECPACRRDAPAADPTLLFRRLADPAASDRAPGFDERAEVEAAIQAVSALRAARRVTGRRGLGRAAGWGRWAAAAVLALLALSLENQGVPGGAAFVEEIAGPAALPSAGGVDQPDARVYHLASEGMSVVMIVDESLDV